MSGVQGDQMSLWKNRPKYSPTHLLSKTMHNFYRGKKDVLTNLSTSPNLVTLMMCIKD
jgi:hypothetical protein